MKNSIVVFIALFFVCSSCSMWNIRQACAYRRQFHSDHDKYKYTDCPYHVYQRGKAGEFYKLLLPIKEECYDSCKGINEDVVKHIYEPNDEKEI